MKAEGISQASDATITMVCTAMRIDPSVTERQARIVEAVLSGGWVSPVEAAEMVNHSVRWIYRRIDEGKIEAEYPHGKGKFGHARQGSVRIAVSQLLPFMA